MLSALRWLIGLSFTLVIATFAALNREDISVIINPLAEPTSLPLYAVIMLSFVIGFIFGGSIVWLNAAASRRAKRKQAKEIKRLEKELGRIKNSKLSSMNTEAGLEVLPVLPAK